MTSATVSVGWALWGKQPGSSNDYSVLASSADPFSQSEFASVLAHFAPGTPPTEPNLPSSLPWVIISRVGVDGKPYVGLAIQRPSQDVDSVGRPITMTSYFCVPFAELSDPPVSYAELYRQLEAVRLPCADSGLIRLSLPRLVPADTAAAMAKESWEPSATAAAAMLLDGPVSIVGSEGSTVDERLRFLDAVASMLPFGLRADLTAATWSDGARHQIRLAFAARPRDDAGVVQWRSASARPAGHGPGSAYFQLLSDVRERDGGAGDDRLAAVVGALASTVAVADFGHPQAAIDAVRAFDLPFIVVAAVLDGTAAAADIRAVFTSGRIAELGPRQRQTMLGALIGLGDTGDLAEIRKWWDDCAGPDPATLAPELVHACRARVWGPAPSLAAGEYLTLADGGGMLDDVLAGLLATPGSEDELTVGAAAAGQLFARWALRDPQPDLPLTRQRVAGDPIAFTALLAEFAQSETELQAALGWIEPGRHEALRPFTFLVGDEPGAVDRLQLTQLGRYAMVCIGALLRAASRRGRLHLVLPAFAGWLALDRAGHDATDPDEDRYWHEQAWALADQGDPHAQAWIDLALLARGEQPRFLLVTVSGRMATRYCEALAAAWPRLAADAGPAADALVTDGLVGYLGRTSWTADPSDVETVVAVATTLAASGRRERLESAVADALLGAPDAARLDCAREWLRRVRPDIDPASHGDVLETLARPPADLDGQKLVELCVRCYLEGRNPEDVCRALAQSRVIESGQEALQLLDRVRGAVYRKQTHQVDPGEWLMELATFIADGTLGDRIPGEFRQAVVRKAYRELGYRLDLMYIAVTGGDRNAQPELSADEIKHLEWIPRSLDQILRDAKKRTGLNPFRWGGRRDRQETDDQPEELADSEQQAR